MSELNLDTSLAFDQDKQSAIVGWCLIDDVFARQCALTVKADWFSSPTVAKIYAAIMEVRSTYHRGPTRDEILTYRPFSREEAAVQKKIPEILADCAKATKRYGLDMLRQEMTKWMQAVIFSQAINRAVDTFNAQKVDDAWKMLEQATLMKMTASFEAGINRGFRDSSERILTEKVERMEQAKKVLAYGIQALDDMLVGIIPNDLIVLGGSTGGGKTQAAVTIARHNAGRGIPVHYFALEAEDNEIERRIKFGILSKAYYAKKDISDPPLGYAEWRMGRAPAEALALEDKLEEDYQAAVKNLKTLYRTSGTFDLDALERALMEVVGESRLIIIDHLHYIDTSEDENHEYKKTVKMIRDIVLRYGVPIIVIAHLRKGAAGKVKTEQLLPGIEEFHGTSDVPKISTTAIMIAKDRNPEHRLEDVEFRHCLPTFMGAVKSRLDGSRTSYVALTHYDPRTGKYMPSYSLSYNESYEVLCGDNVPYWAKNSVRPLTIDYAESRRAAAQSAPDPDKED